MKKRTIVGRQYGRAGGNRDGDEGCILCVYLLWGVNRGGIYLSPLQLTREQPPEDFRHVDRNCDLALEQI